VGKTSKSLSVGSKISAKSGRPDPSNSIRSSRVSAGLARIAFVALAKQVVRWARLRHVSSMMCILSTIPQGMPTNISKGIQRSLVVYQPFQSGNIVVSRDRNSKYDSFSLDYAIYMKIFRWRGYGNVCAYHGCIRSRSCGDMSENDSSNRILVTVIKKWNPANNTLCSHVYVIQ